MTTITIIKPELKIEVTLDDNKSAYNIVAILDALKQFDTTENDNTSGTQGRETT